MTQTHLPISGWWHWCVWDIPAHCTSLPSGIQDYPEGAKLAPNDYGTLDYGGACPPPGDASHQYNFTVYALGTDALGVEQGTQPAMVMFMANAHILAKATLVSYYGR